MLPLIPILAVASPRLPPSPALEAIDLPVNVATMAPEQAHSIAGRLHTFRVKPIEQTSWSQGKWTFATVEAVGR